MSERHVVGVYASYAEAETILSALSEHGFNRSRLSIVSPHVHHEDEIIGFVPRGNVAAWGAVHGALWGMALGVLVAFLAQLPQPSTDPFWLRAVVLFLFGVTFGGTAGLIVGGMTAYSLAPRFFIAPDVSLANERFSLVLDATAPAATRARDMVLTFEKTSPIGLDASAQAI